MLLLRSREEVLLGSEKRRGVEGIERLQLRRWEISDKFCRNPAGHSKQQQWGLR
jgi:hypothetical protein